MHASTWWIWMNDVLYSYYRQNLISAEWSQLSLGSPPINTCYGAEHGCLQEHFSRNLINLLCGPNRSKVVSCILWTCFVVVFLIAERWYMREHVCCPEAEQEPACTRRTCVYCYAFLLAFPKAAGWAVILKLSVLLLLRVYKSACVSNRLPLGPISPRVPTCCGPGYKDILRDGHVNRKTSNCDMVVVSPRAVSEVIHSTFFMSYGVLVYCRAQSLLSSPLLCVFACVLCAFWVCLTAEEPSATNGSWLLLFRLTQNSCSRCRAHGRLSHKVNERWSVWLRKSFIQSLQRPQVGRLWIKQWKKRGIDETNGAKWMELNHFGKCLCLTLPFHLIYILIHACVYGPISMVTTCL